MSYAKYKNLGDQKSATVPTPGVGGGSSQLSPVIEITTREQKARVLNDFRIVVIDVYADWCGPCKQIASRYERLANEMYKQGEIILIKENVESGISDGVKGVPTFQIYKKTPSGESVIVASVVGADINELTNKIKEALST